jgi:tetratricopeptide (TPR) repeat protein
MNEIKIKQNKEIDRPILIRAIGFYLICVGALLVICIFTGGQLLTYKYFIIFSLGEILLSLLFACTIEKLGSVLGGISSGWTSKKISVREQLSADLEKARHSKRSNRFEEALNIINGVLNKDGNSPDALYLKAQILWEGFGKSVESKNLFRRVMKLISSEDPLHRWASDYIDKITASDKLKAHEFMSDEENNKFKNL